MNKDRSSCSVTFQGRLRIIKRLERFEGFSNHFFSATQRRAPLKICASRCSTADWACDGVLKTTWAVIGSVVQSELGAGKTSLSAPSCFRTFFQRAFASIAGGNEEMTTLRMARGSIGVLGW